jgi:hypothetical protein
MSHDTPLPAFHAGKPVATTFGSASTRLLAPQLLFEAVRAQAAGRPAAGAAADGRQPSGNDSRRS